MITPLIDTHCHLDFDCFDSDRQKIIARAHASHVEKIIIPATQKKFWPRIKQLCQPQTDLYACYGLHPYWISQHTQQDLTELEKMLAESDCVAVGECGLDFRPGQADRLLQQNIFESQLSIAQKMALPVVIHCVHATEVIIKTLKQYPALGGMIHSYSGSPEQAVQLIDMGFYLSIGGIITYERASKLRSVVSRIPLTALLLETDAPDQPDQSHRNGRNEPAYLTTTLQAIAKIRKEDIEHIAQQTTQNAKNLFNI